MEKRDKAYYERHLKEGVWNSRYVHFCRVKNLPVGDKEAEREAGEYFILWNTDKWREWSKLNNKNNEYHSVQDHKDYDIWLATVEAEHANKR